MKEPICPFLKKPCIQHDCMFWTHVTMVNPQSGASTDQFGCAVAWLPTLLIEGSLRTRQVAAAVESTRNEITARQDTFNNLVEQSRKGPTLIE
jgi:hypothetical protein